MSPNPLIFKNSQGAPAPSRAREFKPGAAALPPCKPANRRTERRATRQREKLEAGAMGLEMEDQCWV